MQARDVMTTRVVTVSPDTNVREAARILLANRISAVPVVNGKGLVVGMLSEGDLMRRAESDTDGVRSWWLMLLADSRTEAFIRSHGMRARDVMTPKVISVFEDTPLDEVATVLERHRIKRVPVLREDRITGIVSRANLMHGLVAQATPAPNPQDDRAIREAILRTLSNAGIPRYFVNVVVSDGTVHLWGATQSQSEGDAVRVAAETTPGVGRVENHLIVLPPRIQAALGGE